MTEYIFDVPYSNQPIAGEYALYYPDERDEPMAVGEEIVRCGDCKHLRDLTGKQTSFDCFRTYADANPDGFCAWAERRDAQ